MALKEVTPEELLDDPLLDSPTSRLSDFVEVPSSTILARGHAFFTNIYRDATGKILELLETSGTKDLAILIRYVVYGHVLSNESILNAVETSFVLIAALIPQDVRFKSWALLTS